MSFTENVLATHDAKKHETNKLHYNGCIERTDSPNWIKTSHH